VSVAVPRTTRLATAGAKAQSDVELRLSRLLERAEPLGAQWAAKYNTAWALEDNVRRDAKAWSAAAAREVVRHLRTPYAALALGALTVLTVGAANLVTTALLIPQLGAVAGGLIAASGVLVTWFGAQLALRYAGLVLQFRAGIPPLRAKLQLELERHAIAALDRRRERLAGPRRPIPRHAFPDLLPVQAQNIAAGWMRHLGELDATVLKPGDSVERMPALEPEQVHIVSSSYIARAWSFAAETPELELAALEEAVAVTGKRPLLFSLSDFPAELVTRANQRSIALFTYRPWSGTLVGRGTAGERYLRRGLRDADGTPT
jgi:hypothetical protein